MTIIKITSQKKKDEKYLLTRNIAVCNPGIHSSEQISSPIPVHYYNGCFRSKRPVPPFTTFPTTKQAEGELSLSYEPKKKARIETCMHA